MRGREVVLTAESKEQEALLIPLKQREERS
jgi:hypothetical protein